MEGSSETGLVEVSYALDELPASVVRRSKAKVASSGKRKKISDYAIGIDLGTTNSCVAVYRNGEVVIIANNNGNKTTHSYVAFTDTEKIVGDAAKIQAGSNPKNTVYDAKRMIGRKFNDPIFKDKLSIWPFEVFNQRKKPRIRVSHKGDIKIISPEEISASILMELRECANAHLDQNVTKAVITVPAYFNDSQRQATIDAGKIAGFDMINLINEPTAAAIAYGFGRGKNEKNILIYDLGGGTFDVAVLTTKGDKFDVRAVSGDTDLGGRDLDNLLADYVVSHMKRKTGVDLSTNSRAMAILQQKCEIVKQNLSFLPTNKIQIENIIGNLDVNMEITRGRFEDLCEDLFENTLAPVEKALSASRLSKEDIHEVVIVGGSTRIPKVQSILQEFFDGKTLNKSLNPDEAVACGAAIMAAGMSFDSSLVEVSDVIPLALGINVRGELMDKIIESNSKIPIRKEEIFSTVYDNQTSVTLTIQEGEDKHSGRTRVLGEFVLDNVELARAGEPIISVTFEVDVNGILNVSAEDASTKSSNEIAITCNKGRLSEREIDRMRLVEIGDRY